jgi:phage tail-like protein
MATHLRYLRKWRRCMVGSWADDHSLWAWHKQVADGKIERKNRSVVLMSSGKEKIRWNLTNGWPAKWIGPSFNATANEVAVETLEIVHEGVTKS